ncbi:MAG: alanine--tRNA ligase [Candidatus Pacebacteria bacterium CG_4_9_14_3_um_filter_40_12]|nr:MAG: alanine--tRNA ligase [Candidatus Pacebacteria bacterium CG_4_10_14_0_2_um_filter_40_20]PJA69094.1 MAG: alanine--tRNA ligase [Candidatus Pacebacteria bacterium CG_4_9_14_3_um_filter_40_12]PJC41772.1 MAG: alanine--tRNA ligase [Candidatus Pacebacteria bacterium CG_4_9_14_0_2_um_filter_40_15]
MTANELRKKYLTFFEAHQHAVVPSAAMVPENDPSTLFTGSGMQPMVPYLLGEKHPKGTRITDSQKCFRSQDIEEVGDNRHTTFFEMLGNWSLGDYFKKEQLRWFFTFLTQEVGLKPEKLFVTVFSGNESLGIGRDDESVAIWKELFKEVGIEATVGEDSEKNGLQDDRIFFFDEKKNWWSRAGVPSNMPAGEPGGPDSEVFYDFGAEQKLHEMSEFKNMKCHVNCDCGRFLEIGNSVFMQYQKQADGSFKELSQKNVDFGGGFERILAVMTDSQDMFTTALFTPLISKIEEISGKKYSEKSDVTRSFRVIADHVRAATLLAADGVFPSNKEQGYFSRRLLRRAIRFGKMIGIEQPFLAELVTVISAVYAQPYPEVAKKSAAITQAFQTEEKKFQKALEKGLRELDKIKNIDGEVAFKLYETYGFPFELTQEIAVERGDVVSEEDFTQAKKVHADASRKASGEKFKGGLADHSEKTTQYHTATHLLHAALRKILGTHVQQKGSNITHERLRFDFSHTDALSQDEKQQVEDQVNTWISADLPVTVKTMGKKAALKSGAIAFFVEKYPNEVTVYTIGDDDHSGWISKEFCGGPHVSSTGEIGPVEIFKEQSASAGVRRVYLRSKA